jgi:hypothetical protein
MAGAAYVLQKRQYSANILLFFLAAEQSNVIYAKQMFILNK